MVEASNAIIRAKRALRLVLVSIPPAKTVVVVAIDTIASAIKLLSQVKSFIIVLFCLYSVQFLKLHTIKNNVQR